MINISGSEVVSAYTSGSEVMFIYNQNNVVWPELYMKWEPSTASGTFTVSGVTLPLSSYSGYYNGNPVMFSTKNIMTGLSLYTVDDKAFINASRITYFETNLPVLGYRAFSGCSLLTSVSLPNCVSFKTTGSPIWDCGVFANCSNLETVELPELMFIGDTCFENCINLTNISIPKCSNIGLYAFNHCNSLESIVLPPVCTFVGEGAFMYCSSFNTITLLRPSVVYLGGTSVFWSTHLRSIYVPESLVSAYKVASRWSGYENIIYPISNS